MNLKKHAVRSTAPGPYSADAAPPMPLADVFGIEYRFTFPGAVEDCPESAVHVPTLSWLLLQKSGGELRLRERVALPSLVAAARGRQADPTFARLVKFYHAHGGLADGDDLYEALVYAK